MVNRWAALKSSHLQIDEFLKSQPDISSEFIRYLIIFIFSRSFRSSRRSQGAERRGGSRGAGAGWSHAMYSPRINHGNWKSSRIKHGNGKSTIFGPISHIFLLKPPFTVGFAKNAMFDHQRVRILFLDSLTWLIRKWWEWSVWGFDQQECLIKPAILI